jgi:hypothetical protein
MAKYSIEDTTLTNIADAIRDKYPRQTIKREIEVGRQVSKSPNATGFDSFNGAYPDSYTNTDTITIEGATKIKIKIAYQTESTQYDYLQVTVNGITGSKLGGGSTIQTVEYEYEDTNQVKFYFKSDSSNGNYLGYYAEVIGYTVVEEELEEETYTPLEMPEAINNIPIPPSRYVDKFGVSSTSVPQIYNTYSDTSVKGSVLCYENLSSTTSSNSHFVWYKKTKNDTWPMFYCKASNMTNNKPYRVIFYIWCSPGKTVEWANNNVYLNGNCQTTHDLKTITETPQLFVWDFKYIATSSSYEPTFHIYPAFANTDADTMLFVTPVLFFKTGESASAYSTYPAAL